MLSDDQVKSLKTQLIEQVMSSFPDDRKDFAISQIESMDAQQLEDFLIKNGLIKGDSSSSPSQHCVFCSIVFGEISSYKIAENSKAIAVLEINPLSNGHTIIIPKEHINSEGELPKEINSLSKKLSSLIKKRLHPNNIKTEYSNIMGHELVNLIPVYENVPLERKKAEKGDLESLQDILTKKTPAKPKAEKTAQKNPIKKVLKEIETFFWLPKRIP